MKTATLASLCLLAFAGAAGAAADDLPPEDHFPDAYRETPLDARPAHSLMELEPEEGPLRTEIQWMREDPARLAEVEADTVSFPAAAPAPEAPITAEAAQAKEEFFTLDELKSEMKKLAWTKGDFKIVPYGAFWGDMIYNTERTTPGYYTLYVTSAQTDGEDELFVDARRSRFGLDVTGPRIPLLWDAESGGKVEIDFTGDGPVNPNRAGVLLRHAYWEVKDEDFRALVGQTWDVVSPLYPGVLSYSVGWDGGNIGYRRTQFRLERYLKWSDTLLVEVQGSLNQDIIPDFPTTPGVDREPANWPLIEGRLGWVLGPRGKGFNPITFGVSGHIGEVEFDFAQPSPPPLNIPPEDDRHFRTWSFNVDARIPLSDRFGVQGEFFTGENLSSFLGGIGQGVCACNRNTIRSTGGWIDVWYDWTERFHSHAGWGLDDPVNTDFFIGRSYNQFIFLNFSYDITKSFVTGIEITSWKTLYQDRRVGVIANNLLGPTRPGEAVTIEWMVKYSF